MELGASISAHTFVVKPFADDHVVTLGIVLGNFQANSRNHLRQGELRARRKLRARLFVAPGVQYLLTSQL